MNQLGSGDANSLVREIAEAPSGQYVVLSRKKETKHTVVYAGEGGFIETVYVSKEGLPKPFPPQIKLTMEVLR